MSELELYNNELLRKLLERAQQYLADSASSSLDNYAMFEFSTSYRKHFGFKAPQISSPIEAGFDVWWNALMAERAMNRNHYEFDYVLDRQVEVVAGNKHYRLDFVVRPTPDDPHVGYRTYEGFDVALPKIAIELDGHEFHEKTKEQVIQRNQRDRDLQAIGWRVFHVSGSELFKHPEKCVAEIIRVADLAFMDFASAVIRAKEGK
jgi:hypothetical protein